MNLYWIVIAFPSCVQLFLFIRWLHRRTRDDEIRRAFVRDMAVNPSRTSTTPFAKLPRTSASN